MLNINASSVLRKRLKTRLDSLFALSVDVRTLTPSFAAAVRRAGRPIFVFTCNTPRRVERALEAGATGVMSDRPGWLAGYLRRRCAAS